MSVLELSFSHAREQADRLAEHFEPLSRYVFSPNL